MTKVILSIDQGTTSSRTLVFSPEGNVLFTAQEEFPQIYPADEMKKQILSDLALPINAKPPSFGTGPQAKRFTTRLSGKTAAQPKPAARLNRVLMKSGSQQKQAYSLTLISALPKRLGY